MFAICRWYWACLLGPAGRVDAAATARRRWIYMAGHGIFVEFFRNTPVLVQILWFYFALPMLVPFEISPLMAAALGISLNSAAFSAEIFRGGIQSHRPRPVGRRAVRWA
jgi:polar amino acid transport system permease protein